MKAVSPWQSATAVWKAGPRRTRPRLASDRAHMDTCRRNKRSSRRRESLAVHPGREAARSPARSRSGSPEWPVASRRHGWPWRRLGREGRLSCRAAFCPHPPFDDVVRYVQGRRAPVGPRSFVGQCIQAQAWRLNSRPPSAYGVKVRNWSFAPTAPSADRETGSGGSALHRRRGSGFQRPLRAVGGCPFLSKNRVKPRSWPALGELPTANSSRGTLSHGVVRVLAPQRVSQLRLEVSMPRETRPIRVSCAATRRPSIYHSSWGFASLTPGYHPPPLRGCVAVASPFPHVVAALRRCARSSCKSTASEGGHGQTAQENAMKLSETGEAISRSNRHTAAIDIRLRWSALQLVVQPARTMPPTSSPPALSPPGAHGPHFSLARRYLEAGTSMARAQNRLPMTVGRPKTTRRQRQKGGCPNGPIPFFPVISTTIQKGAL